MSPPPRRVVKLGGSLLMLDELVPRLRSWLAAQSPARTILLVGGGPMADAVRRLDQVHGLDATIAHELAIRAMSLNARLVASLLTEMVWCESFEELPPEPLVMFDPWRVLSAKAALPGNVLPVGWHVTSDSIAGWIARQLKADELVLLKSALPDGVGSIAEAAEQGYCDTHLPVVWHQAVRCVNFRSRDFAECRLAK